MCNHCKRQAADDVLNSLTILSEIEEMLPDRGTLEYELCSGTAYVRTAPCDPQLLVNQLHDYIAACRKKYHAQRPADKLCDGTHRP